MHNTPAITGLESPPVWDDPAFIDTIDEIPLWSAVFGLPLLEHMPMRPGMSVLDLGCGTGFPLLELAQRLGAAARLFGLDPWGTALRRARYKSRQYGLGNVWLVQGNAAAPPFADGSFDLIVSTLGINNFAAPRRVFAQSHRVMKPGGTLMLITNLVGNMAEFYEVFDQTLAELGLETVRQALQTHIAHRLTLPTLGRMMEECGFFIVKTFIKPYCLRYTDGPSMLRHQPIRLGFLEAWKALIPYERRQEVFSRLQENLTRYAQSHGELRLTIPVGGIMGRK